MRREFNLNPNALDIRIDGAFIDKVHRTFENAPYRFIENDDAVGCENYCLVTPWENGGSKEIWYTVRRGGGLRYHKHNIGNEIFYITKGGNNIMANGKEGKAVEGDIFVAPTDFPHGFVNLPEGNECFMFFNKAHFYTMTMNLYRSNKYREPEDQLKIKEAIQTHNDNIPLLDLETELVDSLNCIRKPDYAIVKIDVAGACYRLKVGPWELNGTAELWQIQFPKGYQKKEFGLHHSNETYLITNGSAHVCCNGEDFVARKHEVIQIPPYTRYTIDILEDGTSMLTYHDALLLLLPLEEFKASEQRGNTHSDDSSYLNELVKKHNPQLF